MARTVPGSGAVIEPIFNSIKGVRDVVVKDGGSGYDASNPPKLTIGNAGTPIREAVLRPVIGTNGEILAVEVIDPGQGYDPLVLSISTDGNGRNAKGNVVLDDNGGIQYVEMTVKGDNYFYDDVTTVNISGGGGGGAQLVPVTGSVTGLSIENSGRNYEFDDITLIISGGGGTGADGVAEVDEFGKLTNVRIADGGEFFEKAPLIQIVGGGGSGAKATATVELGEITEINIDDPGSGYINPPQVIFARQTNLIRRARNRQSFNSVLYNITGLTKTVQPADTVINVESTSAYAGSGSIFLEKEIIRYTGKTSSSFTGCTRGINFNFDQKIILDDLQTINGVSRYQFDISDRVVRVNEDSGNKIARVYDWNPNTRELFLTFEVDELAFIDGGRSNERSAVIDFNAGTAGSSPTGASPHTLIEVTGSEVVRFTFPNLTVSLDRAFEDIAENNGEGDGIADIDNTGTAYENEISLDGGIASSLYGIEETVGGQNTTLFQQGDQIFDSGGAARLVASVQTAGALGDGNTHINQVQIQLYDTNTNNYIADEGVTAVTTGITATAVSYDSVSKVLVVKDTVNNGANYEYQIGERLNGTNGGAVGYVKSVEYLTAIRNEPD